MHATALGIFAILYMATNTVIWALLCYAMAVVRILLPRKAWRIRWGSAHERHRRRLGVVQSGTFGALLPVRFDTRGLDELTCSRWYLLLSNHQSWTDIVVLQTVFRDLIPPLKFFTKMELIWLPFLGQAMWALDFPFMRRFSRAYLEKFTPICEARTSRRRDACANAFTDANVDHHLPRGYAPDGGEAHRAVIPPCESAQTARRRRRLRPVRHGRPD